MIVFDKNEENFSFSNFTSAIRIKNQNELEFNFLHRFLFYSYLSGITEGMQSHSTGIRNLNLNAYKEIQVPLPPLSEQKRIVKILDEVFEGIEKAKKNVEKNLKNSHELFESYLQNIFTNHGSDWEEKILEELGQITSSKRIYKKEYVKEGIPFYRIKEVKELAHNRNITVELYISNKRYEEIKNVFGVPLAGDILMTAVGTIGEIYVVKKMRSFILKMEMFFGSRTLILSIKLFKIRLNVLCRAD